MAIPMHVLIGIVFSCSLTLSIPIELIQREVLAPVPKESTVDAQEPAVIVVKDPGNIRGTLIIYQKLSASTGGFYSSSDEPTTISQQSNTNVQKSSKFPEPTVKSKESPISKESTGSSQESIFRSAGPTVQSKEFPISKESPASFQEPTSKSTEPTVPSKESPLTPKSTSKSSSTAIQESTSTEPTLKSKESPLTQESSTSSQEVISAFDFKQYGDADDISDNVIFRVKRQQRRRRPSNNRGGNNGGGVSIQGVTQPFCGQFGCTKKPVSRNNTKCPSGSRFDRKSNRCRRVSGGR